MTKFKDGMLGPTVILFAICLVTTFALAGTYYVTEPIIAVAEQAAANAALFGEGSYTEIEMELPEGVQEAYAADDGSGYVFRVNSKGFDGNVVWIINVDGAGSYTGINMFDHSETPGLGSKVGETDYLEQYYGYDDPDAVDGVTGATLTSTSLKNALALVNETYAMVS